MKGIRNSIISCTRIYEKWCYKIYGFLLLQNNQHKHDRNAFHQSALQNNVYWFTDRTKEEKLSWPLTEGLAERRARAAFNKSLKDTRLKLNTVSGYPESNKRGGRMLYTDFGTIPIWLKT